MMILPTGAPSAVMSKNTLVVAIVDGGQRFVESFTEIRPRATSKVRAAASEAGCAGRATPPTPLMCR